MLPKGPIAPVAPLGPSKSSLLVPVPKTIASLLLSNNILPSVNKGVIGPKAVTGNLKLIELSISIESLFIVTKSLEPGAEVLPLVTAKSPLSKDNSTAEVDAPTVGSNDTLPDEGIIFIFLAI